MSQIGKSIAHFLEKYAKNSKEIHINPQSFSQTVILSDGSSTVLRSLSERKPIIYTTLDAFNHPSWIASLRKNKQLLDEQGSVAKFSRRFGENLVSSTWDSLSENSSTKTSSVVSEPKTLKIEVLKKTSASGTKKKAPQSATTNTSKKK